MGTAPKGEEQETCPRAQMFPNDQGRKQGKRYTAMIQIPVDPCQSLITTVSKPFHKTTYATPGNPLKWVTGRPRRPP